MKKFLCLMLLCLLPLTALADDSALMDSVSFWDAPVSLRVADGLLWMTEEGKTLQPIAVKEGFAEAARTLEEKGEHTADPDGMHESLKALLADSLTGGMAVKGMDVHSSEIVLLLEGPGTGMTLRIAEWNGAGYNVLDNSTFPAGSYLDAIHFFDGQAFVWVRDGAEEVGLSFVRLGDEWRLHLVQNNPFWSLAWSAVANMDETSIRRNDGYHYGTLPASWGSFATVNVRDMPLKYEEALKQLDRTSWAVVNNPNPNDRLHLRTEPDKKASSLGKFYNRTPVRVIGEKGAWSQVVIGDNGLTGWMMTEYLTFGKAADSVACAFPNSLELIEEGASTVTRRARAVPDMNAPEMFSVSRTGPDDFIIGVVGDEWYILMTQDGQVGYVPQRWYGEGNG